MSGRDTLCIRVDDAHPATLRAAAELSLAWRAEGGGAVRPPLPGLEATGPTVRLGLGSLVRPSVTVQYDVPFAPDDAREATALGLTVAAWDSLEEQEPWRALSAPVDGLPRLGRPRADAPWAVTLDPTSTLPKPLAHAQRHVLGGLPPTRADGVWWPRWPQVIGAVLGRAACVLGASGPLVFDALRVGIEVFDPGPVTAGTLGAPLGGLVVPSLLGDPRLWQHVALTARDAHARGQTPPPLMSPDWIERGRERIRDARARPRSRWEQLQRRSNKLRRDPARFFADSKFAPLRAVGELAFGRGRALTRP